MAIYGGQRGIWVDRRRTAELTRDGKGITIGLLHTGRSYPDDVSKEAMIYHYPETGVPGKDASEVTATKTSHQLGLPVFAVIYPRPNSVVRDVRLGWVEDSNDDARTFLISFGERKPEEYAPPIDDGADFSPIEPRKSHRAEVEVRTGQTRFRYAVFKRYGARCAVCDLAVDMALDAAHIVIKGENGSDDPRNGLVLCATHHRLYDNGYFAIEPVTLKVVLKKEGTKADELRISRSDLKHMKAFPHQDSLQMRWHQWRD